MDEDSKVGNYLIHLDMGDVLDQDQLDQLTRQLQGEILEQEVESVDLLKEDIVPEGTKSAEAVTWGVLAVSVLPNVLPKLIEFLQLWTMRGESRKIKVRSQIGDQSIELEYSPTSVSKEEIRELISILNTSTQGKADK